MGPTYGEGPISPKPKSQLYPTVWGTLGGGLQTFFKNLENLQIGQTYKQHQMLLYGGLSLVP